MPLDYKHLLTAALLSSSLIACSGEAHQQKQSVPVSDTPAKAVGAAPAELAIPIEEKAERHEANDTVQAETQAAAEKAAAETKAALDTERLAREARAAEDALESKARLEEQARLEAQRRREREAQAVKDTPEQAIIDPPKTIQNIDITPPATISPDPISSEPISSESASQTAVRPEAAPINSAANQAVSTQPAASSPEPQAIKIGPNAAYNNFLSKYVRPVNGINLVAYDKVTPEDRDALRAYIETLSARDIEALPQDAEMATWFNLYNAKTIELILENYPTKSIRKISNPWKKDRLIVNGKKMSLDDIEHNTVRRKYNEPRVHYAFNCASIGCPNVKLTAWEATSLEADLSQAARDFIASERGVSIQDGKVTASSIFKWYKKDFGGNEDALLDHFRQYAVGPKKAALEQADDINKYKYDWDLNIQ